MGPLLALLAPQFLTEFFKGITGALHDYQQGKITIEQLRTQMGVVAMETFAKIEQTNADMVVKTYSSFVELAKTSRLVRIAYVYVVITQASVLVWYEWAVPFIVWKYGGSFPSPGDTLLQWCYGLLILLVGGGMIAIKRPQQPSLPPPPPKPPKG